MKCVKLVKGDKREWPVKVTRRGNGRLSLGSGWGAFSKDNDLKEGDVCILELTERNVFRVLIIHA